MSEPSKVYWVHLEVRCDTHEAAVAVMSVLTLAGSEVRSAKMHVSEPRDKRAEFTDALKRIDPSWKGGES
jgi:hypothetical protein